MPFSVDRSASVNEQSFNAEQLGENTARRPAPEVDQANPSQPASKRLKASEPPNAVSLVQSHHTETSDSRSATSGESAICLALLPVELQDLCFSPLSREEQTDARLISKSVRDSVVISRTREIKTLLNEALGDANCPVARLVVGSRMKSLHFAKQGKDTIEMAIRRVPHTQVGCNTLIKMARAALHLGDLELSKQLAYDALRVIPVAYDNDIDNQYSAIGELAKVLAEGGLVIAGETSHSALNPGQLFITDDASRVLEGIQSLRQAPRTVNAGWDVRNLESGHVEGSSRVLKAAASALAEFGFIEKALALSGDVGLSALDKASILSTVASHVIKTDSARAEQLCRDTQQLLTTLDNMAVRPAWETEALDQARLALGITFRRLGLRTESVNQMNAIQDQDIQDRGVSLTELLLPEAILDSSRALSVALVEQRASSLIELGEISEALKMVTRLVAVNKKGAPEAIQRVLSECEDHLSVFNAEGSDEHNHASLIEFAAVAHQARLFTVAKTALEASGNIALNHQPNPCAYAQMLHETAKKTAEIGYPEEANVIIDIMPTDLGKALSKLNLLVPESSTIVPLSLI